MRLTDYVSQKLAEMGVAKYERQADRIIEKTLATAKKSWSNAEETRLLAQQQLKNELDLVQAELERKTWAYPQSLNFPEPQRVEIRGGYLGDVRAEFRAQTSSIQSGMSTAWVQSPPALGVESVTFTTADVNTTGLSSGFTGTFGNAGSATWAGIGQYPQIQRELIDNELRQQMKEQVRQEVLAELKAQKEQEEKEAIEYVPCLESRRKFKLVEASK